MDLDAPPVLRPGPDTHTVDTDRVLWFDGDATHAFDLRNGTLSWTIPDTTGPGLPLGRDNAGGDGQPPDGVTLVPVETGRLVVESRTGRVIRLIEEPASDRTLPQGQLPGGDSHAVTGTSQIGDVLYERRGGVIHAFKMCNRQSTDASCDAGE